MHPIISSRARLRLYLTAWLPVGTLLAVLVHLQAQVAWAASFGLAVPLALFYALLCLGSWWLCRGQPLEASGIWRLLSVHTLAAGVTCGIWLLAGGLWARILTRQLDDPSIRLGYRTGRPLLLAAGVLLYLLVAALHYLLIAFERSREAERLA